MPDASAFPAVTSEAWSSSTATEYPADAAVVVVTVICFLSVQAAFQVLCVTVSNAPPLWPSLVAVIVLVPTPTVVMTPVPLTVATVVLDDCQVTVRPTSTLPPASFSTAVAWSPAVPNVMELAASVAVTVLTGTAVTVSCAPPLWPSLVAVMVLVPMPTVVMTPVPLTVATVVFDDCQVTVRPTSTLPPASFSTAVAWSPAVPRGIDGVASVTATLLTGIAVAVTLISRK